MASRDWHQRWRHSRVADLIEHDSVWVISDNPVRGTKGLERQKLHLAYQGDLSWHTACGQRLALAREDGGPHDKCLMCAEYAREIEQHSGLDSGG